MPHLSRPIILAALAMAAAPLSLAAAPAAWAIVAGSTAAVNLDAKGLALRGYDPVAYFDSARPTKGLETIAAEHDGARYLFATEAHRRAFLANPSKYVPQFGGFCAVGTSFGEKVDADPETGRVIDGKLYVNFSKRVAVIFDKDVPGTIKRADANWPTVKDKPASVE